MGALTKWGKKPLNVVDQSETAEEHLQVRVLKRPSLWKIYIYFFLHFFFFIYTKEAEDMTSLTVVSVQVLFFFFFFFKPQNSS